MSTSIAVSRSHFDVSSRHDQAFWAAVNAGIWEPYTFRILDFFLGPEWRFVDVGAWAGPTSLYAATKCRHVDAFECDPVALRHLYDNLALNPDILNKVEVHEYALGEEDGVLRLFAPMLGNSETSIFAKHERGAEVLTCRETVLAGVRDVRTVFRERGYANCDRTLVKIDIEGAEFRILPRLADAVGNSRCVWYVSFHELNINPPHLTSRHARIAEMLHTLSAFAPLHWFDFNLAELDKENVLDSVLGGTWPLHSSLLFSSTIPVRSGEH